MIHDNYMKHKFQCPPIKCIGTQSHSIVDILSVAVFVLKEQRWVVAETIIASKPEIFTIGCFRENVC